MFIALCGSMCKYQFTCQYTSFQLPNFVIMPNKRSTIVSPSDVANAFDDGGTLNTSSRELDTKDRTTVPCTRGNGDRVSIAITHSCGMQDRTSAVVSQLLRSELA